MTERDDNRYSRRGVLRTFLGIGLAGTLGYKLRNSHKVQNTDQVTASDIPDAKEIWLGDEKREKIILNLDKPEYLAMVNAPRTGWSQLNAKKFAADTDLGRSLSKRILSADSSNFGTLMSDAYKTDNFNHKEYGEGVNPTRAIPGKFNDTDYVRVLSFVRANVDYVRDGDQGKAQVAQYPLETLVLGNGDCEDQAYLAASILRNSRDVGWIASPERIEDGQRIYHASLGIGVKPGEEVPYANIFDMNEFSRYSLEMFNEGKITNNTKITDLYDVVFEEHPEIVLDKQQSATFEHKGQKYFVLETTSDGFFYRTELPDGYKFEKIN